MLDQGSSLDKNSRWGNYFFGSGKRMLQLNHVGFIFLSFGVMCFIVEL